MAGHAAPAKGEPLPADIRRAIAQGVLHSTRSLSFWLALLFGAFIATDRLLFEPPADRILPVYDGLLAATFLAVWWASRHDRIPPGHAATMAGFVFLLCLPYLLAVLWLSQQPLQSTGLALWQIGCGMFLLSWPWLLALVVASDVLWVAVVLRLPPSDEWGHFGTLLLSANLLAFVAHGVRLRSYGRLAALRLRDLQRQRELEGALEEASQVGEMRRHNELKTRFMNVAAHELATPMTPIMIQIRLLRGMQDRLPAEARRPLDSLERSLDRLNGLLRDILDGSRLQADKLPMAMANLDLHAILSDWVEAYTPVAAEAGVRLTLDAPPGIEVYGDPARLGQVVMNLVSNAVKFTPEGGTVHVTAVRQPGSVRVEVRDEGLGFRPEQAKLLFQPFSQLHEPDAKRRGTGLGLYICKGLVERHGGSVGADSPGVDKGARFWFTLPAA